MYKNEGLSPLNGIIMMVAVTIILAAVVGAFIFSALNKESDGREWKTVNVTVDNVTVIPGGMFSSDSYRVLFGNGDVVVFGKDVNIGENITDFKNVVVNNGSYQMVYSRYNTGYNWILTEVRQI